MQVEIPYVAASQRPTKRVKEEERDTIVVVGQARQKRKRVKAQQQNDAGQTNEGQTNEPAADEASSSSGLLKKEDGESNALEPESFDFSAVHNILDDNPDLEDRNRKKRQKKQSKGWPFLFSFRVWDSLFPSFLVPGGVFYGDFPAPPKAHSELKSGNQSYTFK